MSRNLPTPWSENLASEYKQSGWEGLVRAYYRSLVDRSGKQCSDFPMYGARLLAELGDADAMYQCLDLALDTPSAFLFPPNVSPAFVRYGDDPRFLERLERIGLAPCSPMNCGPWAAQVTDCSICIRVCPYNRRFSKPLQSTTPHRAGITPLREWLPSR